MFSRFVSVSSTHKVSLFLQGGGCGCVAGDPTNQFVANQCVGEVSPCKCSAASSSFDVIANNRYYSPTLNSTAPVCPIGTASKIEAGSENGPMPTTEAVLGLARAALGMPAK